MENFSLAGDIPPPSEADWLALAAKALGNAPFETLRTQLYEGLKTEPIYTNRQDRSPLFGSRGWKVIQPLGGSSAYEARTQCDEEIANGADALSLDFDSGLAIETVEEMKPLLSPGISYFIAPGSSIAGAALLLGATEANGIPGSAGFDPLTAFALSGEMPVERQALLADYTDAACYIRERFPGFVPFLASGHAWDGAGGSAIQELAFTLAAGAAYWRALVNAGMSVSASAQSIGFSLTASADLFLTIAKFRAMRLLWSRALEAAGEKPSLPPMLIAKMSQRVLSAYDPHVNLLRGTAAAFGAAAGGATGIELSPFDAVSAGSTALSRRLARNTGLILKQESYLSAVADVAAGAAYPETLTNEIAAAAWALFREVEAMGGLATAIECGFVRQELQQKSFERQRAVACRKDKITGVSAFPNLSEKAPHGSFVRQKSESRHPFAGKLPAIPAPAAGERFAALIKAARAGSSLHELRAASRRVSSAVLPALALLRDAEPFEAIRKRSDIALDRIGSRPPMFLALLGGTDDYRARANWLQGFFAAGGIELIAPGQPFESAEALAAAFRQSPAPAACLCSSNAVYASMPGAAAALKKAGAVAVYLAGPASVLKTLTPQDAVAVDRLVYEGCDALALLREAQGALRVEELSAAAEEEAAEEGFEVHTHPHAHGHGCGCC